MQKSLQINKGSNNVQTPILVMILTTRSSKLSKTNYKLKGSNTMYKFNNSNKAVIFRRVAQGLLTSDDSVGDSRRLLKNESLLKSLKVFL